MQVRARDERESPSVERRVPLEFVSRLRSNTAMPRPDHRSTFTLLLALALALVGCHQCGHGAEVGGDGGLVGGDCKKNKECVDECLGGSKFPNGTCSVPCDGDGDCPEFTRCIEVEGGMCLLDCDADDECRPGYGCHDQERHGHDGVALVCIDD